MTFGIQIKTSEGDTNSLDLSSICEHKVKKATTSTSAAVVVTPPSGWSSSKDYVLIYNTTDDVVVGESTRNNKGITYSGGVYTIPTSAYTTSKLLNFYFVEVN